MASKKKPANKKANEIRFVVLPNGAEQEIVREDGKYYYTATSQFRRATHDVKIVVQDKPEQKKETEEKTE